MFNNVTNSLVARAEVECGMLLKTVKDQRHKLLHG